ncbi:MAG TPA: TraR/DksA C4-type zinc finger protein [Actinomycetota bacterium]|nr:TraR/DksA C4-type zinc finger protein [Actinomycetota bacterium]
MPPLLEAQLRSALAEHRRQAEAQVSALTAQLDDIVDSTRFVATDDEHDPDGSTVGFERAKIAALLDAAWARLAEVEAVLERMETGRYGTCEGCGEPIAHERLLARPVATRCVACAAASPRQAPRSARHC